MKKPEHYCKDCRYSYQHKNNLWCELVTVATHPGFRIERPGFRVGKYDECEHWEPKEEK